MLRYKIPLKLYMKIARQLMYQRIDGKKKWRLAALFDELLAYIFLNIIRKVPCKFNVLFLNACAHYQHHFWRNFKPNKFDMSIKSSDCNEKDNPIEYGYCLYDQILGLFLKYIDKKPNTLLVIVSAFSQEPFLSCEDQGGMNYYRLIDHQKFVNMLSLPKCEVFPLMSRDWQVNVSRAEDLKVIMNILSSLKVDGQILFRVVVNSSTSLFIETDVTRKINKGTYIVDADGNKIITFDKAMVSIAIKSGHHKDEGAVWLSSPQNEYQSPMKLSDLYKLNLSSLGVKT